MSTHLPNDVTEAVPTLTHGNEHDAVRIINNPLDQVAAEAHEHEHSDSPSLAHGYTRATATTTRDRRTVSRPSEQARRTAASELARSVRWLAVRAGIGGDAR